MSETEKIIVLAASTAGLVLGLLGGAVLFNAGGWRYVLVIAGVTILSAGVTARGVTR
jgi:hypothetical protein